MKIITILLLLIKAAYLFELNSTNHIEKGIVYNGVPYSPKEFPYLVTIHIISEDKKMGRTCTGSLIRELYVMTAAHCAYRINEKNIKVSTLMQYFHCNELTMP